MNEIEEYYNNLHHTSAVIHTYVIIIPIVVGLYRRKRLTKPLLLFLIYLLLILGVNLLEKFFIWLTDHYYAYLKKPMDYFEIENTYFIQILAYLNNFIFLGFFYALLVSIKYKSWIKRTAISLAVIAIINYLFFEGHKVQGVINPTLDVIFSFALPAFYLWFMYRENLSFPIKKNPYFWISFGLIFTNLIGFFLYVAGDAIYGEDFILFVKMSVAKNIFDMIALLIMAIGFWHAPYAKYVAPSKE